MGDLPLGSIVVPLHASAGHHLYVHGGHDGTDRHSSLYQLNTIRSWTWEQLSSSGPVKKAWVRDGRL